MPDRDPGAQGRRRWRRGRAEGKRCGAPLAEDARVLTSKKERLAREAAETYGVSVFRPRTGPTCKANCGAGARGEGTRRAQVPSAAPASAAGLARGLVRPGASSLLEGHQSANPLCARLRCG